MLKAFYKSSEHCKWKVDGKMAPALLANPYS